MEESLKDVSFLHLSCLLLLVLSSLMSILKISTAIDTINTTQTLKDGDKLVSSGGNFELGFFSLGDSENRYVGVWHTKVTLLTPIWVLNREIPLTNRTGILKFNDQGHLVLVNETNGLAWLSNTTRIARNPVAQLLDSGNFVLREANDDNPDNVLWQSFDYLGDTHIPGPKSYFGLNPTTGVQIYLSSWTSNDDPARGDYTCNFVSKGYPQLYIKKGELVMHRVGPWNGLRYSGQPHVTVVFKQKIFVDQNMTYYTEDVTDKSVISRTTMNHTGDLQRWLWVDENRGWVLYLNVPQDNCDTYRLCGAYGTCYIGNSPACDCLNKFVPKDQENWIRGDWSSGCIREKPLNCQAGDAFLKYSSVKLPDARNSTFNASMTLEECKETCLRDCSCTAYTQLDLSRGIGCLFWFGELLDLRDMSSEGQDLYIRMSSSELENSEGKKRILVAILASLIGSALLGLSLVLYFWRRCKRKKMDPMTLTRIPGSHKKDMDLPLFDLATISKATNNFSNDNKLGEGGFGPVYKGMLEEGQEIAVKRLSKTSMQGNKEFTNEVICIAKLQHRNLVRILGCCIEGEEKMLIYEYMPNKSLDFFLFNETHKMLLDWNKRFQIVNGIARGLMYLHQDSRLRIIHRDLKASNILLDVDMNPKISDFGIARSYGGNEIEDKTNRVVGTYGYISPEYAMHGRFSIKSDVFSFGVLVLEIVSGKRNRGFSAKHQHLSLLGHAWTLYKEGRSMELVDAYLSDSPNLFEVQRLIHLALLCVQQRPDDRPSMTTVVSMLSNDGPLPEAHRPGFFSEADILSDGSSSFATCSTNEATMTQMEPR